MRQLKITQSVTNRTSKAVEKYLSDVSKIPLITNEREIELASKIKDGDEKALQELVRANLRFVVSVSKQYQNRGVPLPDLINEGNVGLIKAARKFDATRGFKFISFAVWWIRQSILQTIADYGRVIRIPLNKIGLQNKFSKSYSFLEQELGRQPSDVEVMEHMGLSEKEIKDLVQSMSRVCSYDAPMNDDEGSASLLEVIKPSEGDVDTPDEPLMFKESINIDINRVISTLTENERKMLELFFGLNGNAPMSLTEIASKYEYSPERVRQIKEKALRRLRTHDRSTVLRKYLN